MAINTESKNAIKELKATVALLEAALSKLKSNYEGFGRFYGAHKRELSPENNTALESMEETEFIKKYRLYTQIKIQFNAILESYQAAEAYVTTTMPKNFDQLKKAMERLTATLTNARSEVEKTLTNFATVKEKRKKKKPGARRF